MRKQTEKDKLTALYERPSHDDERAGEFTVRKKAGLLTPEETEHLAAYRRKKAGLQRARREGKKSGQPRKKVS